MELIEFPQLYYCNSLKKLCPFPVEDTPKFSEIVSAISEKCP